MPNSKQSRSRTAPKPKGTIAVRDKSELDLSFELIVIEMKDGFDRVQAEMEASFKEAVNSLPSADSVLSEVDTTFDMIEQNIEELLAKFETKRKEGRPDDATVQASVALAKELSATEDATTMLWQETYDAYVRAANVYAGIATLYSASPTPDS